MIKKINVRWVTGLVLSFACCALFAGLVSFRTMPISEGWYTEYAWQINHGNLPYRDFEYLFFPLYMYFIAGFTRIFGYSIIALRILGIFVFGGIGAALYCLFARLFDNFSGMIGAVAAALFLQSEAGQVFYDYIRFHDLFAIITGCFLLGLSCDSIEGKEIRHSKSGRVVLYVLHILIPVLVMVNGWVGLINNPVSEHRLRGTIFIALICLGVMMLVALGLMKKKNVLGHAIDSISAKAVWCGIFVSAECMVKQSNGVLMIVYVSVYLLFCAAALRNKKFLMDFWGVISGIVLMFSVFLTYLLATNSFDAFVQCCFKNALAAKGGIMVTLFRWIPSSWALFWQEREKVIIIILYLYILIDKCLRMKKTEKRNYHEGLIVLAGVSLALVTFALAKNMEWAAKADSVYNTNLPAISFFLCALAFLGYGVYLVVQFIREREPEGIGRECFPMFSVLGVIFAQGYGCGMSGGLATSQTAIGFGILLALCIHAALRAEKKAVIAAVTIFSIFLSGSFIGRKTIQTYNWWGLTQDALAEHTESIDVPLLAGIKVREMDKVYYETIYYDVIENTDPGDYIYVFPQCPIIYTMTDRHSLTYAKVQWFDVSSVDSLERDKEILSENLPAMIVYVNVPEHVYASHEAAFSTWQTRVMKDFLLKTIIPENDYEILHEEDMGNGYSVITYILPE